MSKASVPQLASALVMVRPVDFGFNEETGLDNEFQNRPQQPAAEITKSALCEFEAMAESLSKQHIQLTILDKSHTESRLPDAVFPNNWFSTRSDGRLFIYPMKTHNRRAEVQIENLTTTLANDGFKVSEVIDLRQQWPDDIALEGTGSLIFHHPSSRLFAAISERCDEQAVAWYAEQFGYQLVAAETRSAHGAPVYHTNVLMSCGEDFAVIVEDILQPTVARRNFMQSLQETVADVLTISEQQMANHFCGNIIQVQNSRGTPCIVMSQSAWQGFTPVQKRMLEKHGEIITNNIQTIEHIGGGSARCMVAENFLPSVDG